jgi:serine/threonine-protein kinase RsbW
VTEDSSAVRLELDSRPEAPALVRAALAGVAQSIELEPELFNDLKTAVSEACNNVVLHAYGDQPGPMVFGLEIRPDRVDATVRDWGSGIQHAHPSDERMGVGLAVISALASRAEFVSAPDGGTQVRMSFVPRHASSRPLPASEHPDLDPGAPLRLSGDVVGTVSPAALLPGVLGRVARAVAARTHLSVDRFSDIYLVADAIAALAESAAIAPAVTFAVTAGHKRLELAAGLFRSGTGARLLEVGAAEQSWTSLPSVAGDFAAAEPVEDHELIHVVIADSRRSGAPVN